METTVAVPSLVPPAPVAVLPKEEYERRLRAVRQQMRDRGYHALLLVSPENIYYLTGLNHQGYFAFTLLVLPLQGPPLLVARRMESPTICAQVPGCVHIGFEDDADPADAAVEAIRQVTIVGDAVAAECTSMYFPIRVWERIRTPLDDRIWEDGSGLVETIRIVKSPEEIALLRRAAVISDQAMQAGIAAAGEGVRESTIAAAVYHEMVAGGSDSPGFAPCIRGSDILHQEHVTWRDRPLPAGGALFMELSASLGRYHAPLTRLVHVGPAQPGTWKMADIALTGMDEIVSRLRPGAIMGDLYDAWQNVVNKGLGHDRYHRHHCGYLVGIGFPPSWVGGNTVIGLRAGNEMIVREGMAFHVLSWLIGEEPADYVVSDTVLVTSTGCEVLTTTQREPIVVT